jgi:hypothetical protein
MQTFNSINADMVSPKDALGRVPMSAQQCFDFTVLKCALCSFSAIVEMHRYRTVGNAILSFLYCFDGRLGYKSC